jgi:nicotinate phosphoribosyltransferase
MKITEESKGLFTDLYELTMAASYFGNGFFSPATFSLFIRKYPENRGYFVSAGLKSVLEYLESLSFEQDDLDYLASRRLFSDDFLHYLSEFRFTGEVRAIEEGRLFFQDEPVLEIAAPIIEGQIAETFVINAMNLEVCIATKASRCVRAAAGRELVDFSLRRTQGRDAGLKVARACHIAGFDATSNVLAGKLYGLPIAGTMAHSYVTSFEDEIDAFRAYSRTFPDNTVLLIDTYDTLRGARKAVEVARQMATRGYRLRGVRLDSGDMVALSDQVRKIFDEAGMEDVKIFASGGFDEYGIEDVLKRGAKIDAFGVGTRMGVSADAPYTDMAYKLVKYAGRPVLKLSFGKKSLATEKQVFRKYDNGMLAGDVIGLKDEELGDEKLLQTVMKEGINISKSGSLDEARERFREEFERLDEPYKAIRNPSNYPVELSRNLKLLQEKTVEETKERELDVT